jgi:hypothetical protein
VCVCVCVCVCACVRNRVCVRVCHKHKQVRPHGRALQVDRRQPMAGPGGYTSSRSIRETVRGSVYRLSLLAIAQVTRGFQLSGLRSLLLEKTTNLPDH